jgi:PAS domain S-box-containing protein
MEKLTNRILLIDDNADNLELLSDLIQHAFPGYHTPTASSGIRGLELAASEEPDVILLDVVMPGMNGFETCQKLKSDPKTSLIPVVFLTAIKSDREARLQGIEVGAEAFISRPVDESELIAQIRAMQKIKRAALLQRDEKENLTSLVSAQTQALQQTHTATLNLLEDLHAENEARKKNEAALRISEAALKQAQRVAHLGSWIWHIQSNRLEWSDEMYRIFGIQKHDFSGDLNEVVAHAIHPDDRQKVERSNQSVSEHGRPIPLEYRVIRPDGTIRTVWAEAGELNLDEEGRPDTLTGIVQDISERKQAEEALLDSEDKFRYMFEYSVAPKSITQINGAMQVNQAFCDMLGYSREELENRTWQEITHLDDQEMNQKAIDALLRGEKESIRLTKRYIHKDGSSVWVDFGTALRRDKNGQPLYLVSTFNDITERKLAEEALRLRESYQAAILENQPGLLWLKDAQSRFLTVNRAFALACGKARPEELHGLTDLDIWPKELAEKYRVDDAKVMADKAPVFLEEPILTRGKTTWFETFKTPVLDEHGNVIGTTGFSLDITERKQAQALQQAVYQISAAAETTASLDELYPKIHQSISSVMPAENFFIALYDETKNLLHFPYFKDPNDADFVNGVRPGRGTTAYVLRTGKSLLCTQTLHKELERLGEVTLLGVPSAIWLGVPLIVEGKTIGAMVVQHYSDPLAYGEREQQILEFVSIQVAIAIDRKLAEEALKASETRYRGLFEHSPVSLWEEDFSEVKRHIEKIREKGVTDFRAFFKSHPDELLACVYAIKVLDVNAATLALMHATRKDLLVGGMHETIQIKPDMDFVDEMVNIAEGRTEFTWDGINYSLDGERLFISLHWTAAPGYEDSLEKVLVSIMDITQRKQAEEKVRANEAQLSEALDIAKLANWEYDVEKDIFIFNDHFYSIFHTTAEAMGGYLLSSAQYAKRLVHPEDMPVVGKAIGKALASTDQHYSTQLEHRVVYADGGVGYISVIIHIDRDDQGHILRYYGANQDITERRQAEDQIRQLNAGLEQRVIERTRQLREAQEQLVRQEKLATLGQLAGGVGHELRNPLGVINSAVYYLKMVQPDADEKIKKYHLMIEQEVNTAGRIINDLLDFGRIVSPDRQPVGVPELLERVLVRFPAPASVRVVIKIPDSLPKVFADPLHLEQVLGNLTTNACQAMKDSKDGGQLTISASLKKGQVAIAIKDTGSGITPEHMQKIFEPLFTTKLRGIGLGLPVSKKLAEANGGSITVRSEPGKGSIFTVYLPVKP